MYALLILIGFVLIAYLFYSVELREWMIHWGSTAEERAYRFPGYEKIWRPHIEITRAITINATPEEIYPWINQLGRGAGWYSYDKYDNGGYPSADYIIPDIPLAKLGDKSELGEVISTASYDHIAWLSKKRHLLLSRADITYTYSLLPLNQKQTRLLVRVRLVSTGVFDWIDLRYFEFRDFIRMKRQLLNLKYLIETYPRRLEAGLINKDEAPFGHQKSKWSYALS